MDGLNDDSQLSLVVPSDSQYDCDLSVVAQVLPLAGGSAKSCYVFGVITFGKKYYAVSVLGCLEKQVFYTSWVGHLDLR